MDTRIKFDVFISYRREGGEVLGRLLFELLKNEYNVFFDHESLSSGRFDTKLLNIIEECNDFIVILSKDCLKRCSNDGDWFMAEISCALRNNKNIILLIDEAFNMPAGTELLSQPQEIQDLLKYNGYSLSIAYIDSIVAKLRNDMRTSPRKTSSPFDNIAEWKILNKHLQDKNFTMLLPDDLKMSIVNNAISSFLDEYSAKILIDMLTRLSDKIYNVRTKFRYEIDIRDQFDFKIVDIDPEKYYELSESLSYTKEFRSDKPSETFWLSFSTKLTELDSELHAEDFFFSENLTVFPEDMKCLSKMSDEEKEDFYSSVMRIKLNINGNILSPDKIIINESGIFGRYSLPDDIDSGTLNVKLRFKIPQSYTNSFFFACISEPTYSPFIRISYDEDEFDVEMIPFLTRSLTAKDTKVFEGVRELSVENEWIMPVSGAIFLIKKVDT